MCTETFNVPSIVSAPSLANHHVSRGNENVILSSPQLLKVLTNKVKELGSIGQFHGSNQWIINMIRDITLKVRIIRRSILCRATNSDWHFLVVDLIKLIPALHRWRDIGHI